MKKYESVIIVNSNLDDGKIKALIEKFSKLVNEHGKVENVQEMGKKKLAYPIQRQEEGYYVVFNFEAEPTFIAELERIYRITDEILKFIVVKKED